MAMWTISKTKTFLLITVTISLWYGESLSFSTFIHIHLFLYVHLLYLDARHPFPDRVHVLKHFIYEVKASFFSIHSVVANILYFEIRSFCYFFLFLFLLLCWCMIRHLKLIHLFYLILFMFLLESISICFRVVWFLFSWFSCSLALWLTKMKHLFLSRNLICVKRKKT